MGRMAIFVGFMAFFVLDKTMRVLSASAGDGHGHGHSHIQPLQVSEGNAEGKSTALSTSDEELRSRKSPSTDISISKELAEPLKEVPEGGAGVNPSLRLSAYLNLFGDFTHNITDGLAMAANFYTSPALGAVTTIATFCHEIPHEVSLSSIPCSYLGPEPRAARI